MPDQRVGVAAEDHRMLALGARQAGVDRLLQMVHIVHADTPDVIRVGNDGQIGHAIERMIGGFAREPGHLGDPAVGNQLAK